MKSIYYLPLLFVIACTSKPSEQPKVEEVPDRFPLPEVSIYESNGDTLKMNEIGMDKDFVVILFESTCDYCHKETLSIDSIADQFEEIPVLFLSTESVDTVRSYRSKYFTSTMDEFVFGRISLEHMKILADDVPAFPTVMWFSKNGGLKVRNRGLIAPDRIVRTIRQQTTSFK